MKYLSANQAKTHFSDRSKLLNLKMLVARAKDDIKAGRIFDGEKLFNDLLNAKFDQSMVPENHLGNRL